MKPALGAAECIGVDQGLHAFTLGAAHGLGLDGEIGSIECGKRADFCVLDEDPTASDPMALEALRPWGAAQGERVFASDRS